MFLPVLRRKIASNEYVSTRRVIYLSWNFDEEKKREKICCTSSLKSSTRVEKIYYNGIGKMDERKIPEILVRRKIRRIE